ncbi:MAG: peptidyl-prolyl cis-trans isomerase [Acidobacteria bacterium]|nr:MAG: peptidyl-prolyl cis-trans isomerase [Acidobacteriota bacterium]
MRGPAAGRRAVLVGLAFLVALLPACARKGPRAASRASVVALVGDRPVELSDYAAYVRQATREEPKAVSPRVASSLLDQYLEELLLERAVEDAVPPAKGTNAEERRRDLINRRARLHEIGEADLRKEYEAHADRWKRPPLVRLSQLIVPTKEKADEARKLLEKGTPWLTVSRTLSLAPNAASGGGLGWLSREDLPAEFEKPVWGLPAGGTTPPLPAPHGFHVFRVEDRADTRVVPFEEAAPGLRLTLAEELSSAAVAELMAESARRHPLVVVEDHLPFPYVGALPRHGERR